MNRISGLNYTVVPDKKNEDKIADYLKNCCAVYREYEGREEFKYMIARAALRKEIMSELPDVLPDLSNFGAAPSSVETSPAGDEGGPCSGNRGLVGAAEHQ
jgi:hypothetical protein